MEAENEALVARLKLTADQGGIPQQTPGTDFCADPAAVPLYAKELFPLLPFSGTSPVPSYRRPVLKETASRQGVT